MMDIMGEVKWFFIRQALGIFLMGGGDRMTLMYCTMQNVKEALSLSIVHVILEYLFFAISML